jgi:phosphomannomutase
MTLIRSISGIRGIVGGKPAEGLTPPEIVRYVSAYAEWLRGRLPGKRLRVVTGRDSRVSGESISDIVNSTLMLSGIDVTWLGQASTPTVEIAVFRSGSDGGIIITASHNPAEWNALKLLDSRGEFLSAEDGGKILAIADSGNFKYCGNDDMGTKKYEDDWNRKHIDMVLSHPLTDRKAISSARLTVAADCVNSVGGMIIPDLLKELGVSRIIPVNCEPTGLFSHNPEPLPGNLTELAETVVREKADMGIAVDPDVDRLAIVCEDGSMFGEEYTLVAVSDYLLGIRPGTTVSNMSSSRALKDVTESHGCRYFSSPVGEVNVVEEMKKRGAVIGGEGNGGIILPDLHYGRDALAGVALFLSCLTTRQLKCSELKRSLPCWHMSKNKIPLNPDHNLARISDAIMSEFAGSSFDNRDGLRVENEKGWVHIRISNTEPVIRINSEAETVAGAEELISRVSEVVKKI